MGFLSDDEVSVCTFEESLGSPCQSRKFRFGGDLCSFKIRSWSWRARLTDFWVPGACPGHSAQNRPADLRIDLRWGQND
ncbi:MAG: hypothetical protein ACI841_004598 [Planctomycetota bacterium]|jgi:hypothetical protein